MKLKIQNRYKLPKNIYVYLTHVLGNGTMVAFGKFDDSKLNKYCLITLSSNEVSHSIIDNLEDVFVTKHHDPVLIAIDNNSFGIIDNGDTLYVYNDILKQPKVIKISNHKTFSELREREIPRTSNHGITCLS
jgi:hypothetical protein